MSQSPDQVAASILSTLHQTAPGLSCAVGTPERQIIDACAEAISAAYVGQYLTGGMMDINTKSGLELEQFVGIFGFGRLQGGKATGTVTVTATVASNTDLTIPLGSQFYTTAGLAGATATVYYGTTQTVVLPANSYTISVPVECTMVGTVGNVAPESITSQAAAIGASSVTNLSPMTGGVDVETDPALRQRFMDTLLRNISGTKDWYINTALQNKKVSRAVVYGPTTLFALQLSAPVKGGTVTLDASHGVPTGDVKYVWPDMTSCFTNLAQANEKFYSPVDDYTFTPGVPPQFTTNNPSSSITSTVGNLEIVDLEFQYTSYASRNAPSSGITNKLDVYVDGSMPLMVTETSSVPATTNASAKLTSTNTQPLWTGNFQRVGAPGAVESGSPIAGNRFSRLGNVPVINFPNSITISGTTYNRGTHYHLLAPKTYDAGGPTALWPNATTVLAGSQREICGIEWESTGSPVVGDDAIFTVGYTYNQVPQILDAVYGASKQVCTDVLAHQADYQYITTCLTVEYDRTYSVATVEAAITSRLQLYWQGLGFGASIKLSNLASAVQQVLGVVDVHVTTQAEATAAGKTTYGLLVYNNSSDTAAALNVAPPSDYKLLDSQIAVYKNQIILRAPTT